MWHLTFFSRQGGLFKDIHTQKTETRKHREASAPTFPAGLILHQLQKRMLPTNTAWVAGTILTSLLRRCYLRWVTLIPLVIFGFLLLFGWAEVHCVAQMSCPWQISKKPGSLLCPLPILWKWTGPLSTLSVSHVSTHHFFPPHSTSSRGWPCAWCYVC